MKNGAKILAWLLVALTFAGAMVWDWHTPVSADDWCYLTVPPEGDDIGFWGGRGRHIESWSDVGESLSRHFGMINGRLPNMAHTILAHIGHGPESLLLGACIGLFALMMALAGDTRRRLTPWSAMLAIALMWSAMPWYDYFQSLDFQMNYVPTSTMVLGLILLFPKINDIGRKTYVATLILALLTGGMHEGFTIPLLVWLGVSAIINPAFRTRRAAGWGAALSVGLAIILVGGIGQRLDQQANLIDYSQLRFHATRIISAMWPLFLAMLFTAIELIANKKDRRATIRSLAALYAAALIAAAIPVVLMLFGRVYWPMALFSSLIIMRIATHWFESVPVRITIYNTALFIVLYTWWLFTLCKYEIRIGSEFQATIAQFEARQAEGKAFSGVIYLDAISDDEIPSELMGIVRQPLDDGLTTNRLASYYGGFFEFAIAVDPALEGKSLEEWPLMPGNSGLRGRWPMLATADTSHAHFIATAGPTTENMPATDRLLVAAKAIIGQPTDTAEHIFQFAYKAIAMPDGSTAYRCLVGDLPRTFRHRPILRIDTLSETEYNAKL